MRTTGITLAVIFMHAFIVVAGAASIDGQAMPKDVTVNLRVPEMLILDINNSSMADALQKNELNNTEKLSQSTVQASATLTGSMLSTVDWVITGPQDPVYMSDGNHALKTALSTSVNPTTGGPGFTNINTSYSQPFTSEDLAGAYDGRVSWIASAVF